MIDGPPTETLPVTEAKPHLFALVRGPAWLLTAPPGTRERAEFLFGCKLIDALPIPPVPFAECAGAIYIGDESCGVPFECAGVLHYFFERDKGEALVFHYRPFENDFVAVTLEWLTCRARE